MEEGVHLIQRVLVDGPLLATLQDAARAVALLADTGPDDDAEEEAVLSDAEAFVAHGHPASGIRAHLAVVTRPMAHVVQHVAPRVPPTGDSRAHQGTHGMRKEKHYGDEHKRLHRVRVLHFLGIPRPQHGVCTVSF